jgi:DNA-binding CsgD family transcriptional regulator
MGSVPKRRLPEPLPPDADAVILEDGSMLVSFATPAAAPVLTNAERAVAALVLAGCDNATIARARGTSVRTVANLLARCFRKLGVSSRAELAALVHGSKSP